MIHFVLDDLRYPAGIGLDTSMQFQSLILDLDGFITFARALTTEKRQASLLSDICSVLFNDLRIKHYRVRRNSSALVKKYNDPLLNTDHIRRHADTTFSVLHQRVKQVLRDLQIFFCRHLRLPCKEYRIVHKFFNHYSVPFTQSQCRTHRIEYDHIPFIASCPKIYQTIPRRWEQGLI